MKKILILFSLIFGIFLIGSVTAYNGYYGDYSLSGILDSLDASMVFLGAVFIILFAVLNFSLSRVFKDQKSTAGIVAFIISFFVIYGINRAGINYENFFYSFGFLGDFFYAAAPFIGIILVVVSIIWLGLAKTLIIAGGIIIGFIFVLDPYNKIAPFIVGAILIGIGGWLFKTGKGRKITIEKNL